jgi:coenzyme F420-0:L-glutamate ligase
MLLLPIRLPIIVPGTDLGSLIREHSTLQPEDILIVSSKALATAEGSIVDLQTMEPGEEARSLSKETGRSPAFMEAVLRETTRHRGHLRGTAPGAVLTELRPSGLERGTILIANAGLDESNVKPGTAIGWPNDPVRSAADLRKTLGEIAVIVTDSSCVPRRRGVTAIALAVSGIDPFTSEIGKKDLFGRELVVTVEATADQLATAANMIMGNADQAIPAVIIREHGVPFSVFEGWIPGIEPEEDLFRGMFRDF